MIENLVNFDFIISLKTAPEPDFYFPATKSKTDILLQTLVLVYLRLTINGSQPIFSPQENDALHGFYIKFSIGRQFSFLLFLILNLEVSNF